MNDPVSIVAAVYAARRSRDIDAALALCADAVICTFNADPDKPGSGRTIIGKAQNRAHLELIDDHWEPISTTVGPLRPVLRNEAAGGDCNLAPATDIRVHISFALRHRRSGQVLEGTKTHEWTVRDGKITVLCETLDREFIHAFLRMSEAMVRDSQTPADLPTSAPLRRV